MESYDNKNNNVNTINIINTMMNNHLSDLTQKAKKQAIESFKSLGYRCFAAGDTHNDIQMIEVADKGLFINAPLKISSKHPEIESYDNYNDLEKAIYSNSIFAQT